MDPLELCPCLDTFFPGVPAERSLPEIAALGFRQVEIWDWRRWDEGALARAAAETGVRLRACSGATFAEPLVDAAAHAGTLDHLRRSLDVAQRLRVEMLVVHVGYTLAGRSREGQWAAARAGLRAAGDLAAPAGVTLLVEPLNSVIDHPGYFLDTLPEGLRLVADVAHPAVRLLLDVYHMRLMHEDLLDRLPGTLPLTAHVHVADVPGRGEPGSGQIAWPAVLRALRDGGYRGAVGLECRPTGTPEAALRRSRDVLTGPPGRRLVGRITT